MFRLKKCEVRASEIAEYLNRELIGDDFVIKSPYCIITPACLNRMHTRGVDYSGDMLLISDQIKLESGCVGCIYSEHPELDLGYILREFFSTPPLHVIHATAVIAANAVIGRNVMIGAHSYIGPDVEIADNTVILSNVVINGPATIGKFCVVKDGAVIGSEGWGFIDDESGVPFHTPQFGRILIGDQVWIGSNSTVERAMLNDTIISSYVKIDDLVHIGAGTTIDTGSMVTAGTVVAYNVAIGKNVKIAPNVVIRENIHVNDNVVIGLGTVVIEDLASGGIYIGNPAKQLKPREEI